MEIADKTVLCMVLLTVEVRFVATCFAMGDCLVAVFQQVVQFFQGYGLKENDSQDIGGHSLVCWI